MKRSFIITALLLLIAFRLSAQQTESNQEYKHDLGFNTTFIFQNLVSSSGTPISLMYKKYTASNKAFRFGGEVGVDLRTEDPRSSSYYTNQSDIDIALTFGKEKQSNINKHWVFYYGGDLVPFLIQSRFQDYNNNHLSWDYYSQNFGIGLRPFLGIRYAINSKLYVSAEASLSMRYGYSTRLNKSFTYNPDQVVYVQTDSKGNNISAHLYPASGIFLFYRF
jgi:hypothetical protein